MHRFNPESSHRVRGTKAAVARGGGIFSLLVLLAGCVGKPEFVGYLTNSDDAVHDILKQPVAPNSLVLLRREPDNLLNLQIGGPEIEGTESSIKPGQYSIILTLAAFNSLPRGKPSVFIPLLNRQHVEIRRVSTAASGRSLILDMSADRLGVDILLTGLTAPGGLQGVAYFADSSTSIPISAEAFREEFAWARLYTAKDIFGNQCLGVSNVSEYPFRVWGIALQDGNQDRVARTIDPFEMEWSCFYFSTAFDPTNVGVSKTRYWAVPNEILSKYLEAGR
jgi:hypothetical protein